MCHTRPMTSRTSLEAHFEVLAARLRHVLGPHG